MKEECPALHIANILLILTAVEPLIVLQGGLLQRIILIDPVPQPPLHLLLLLLLPLQELRNQLDTSLLLLILDALPDVVHHEVLVVDSPHTTVMVLGKEPFEPEPRPACLK